MTLPLDENTTKSLIRKIKALLAKTIEQGATEFEAMNAMAKAHELLAKHQLELSDLDIRAEGTEKVTVEWDFIKDFLAVNVAKYCECRVWQNSKEKKLHFLGIKTDAVFADWLILALTDFVTKQEVSFMFSDECTTTGEGTKAKQAKLEINSFVRGCVQRINERLREEIAKRERERCSFSSSSGRDLIPLKNAMITEAMAKLNLNLGRARTTKQQSVDVNSYNIGKRAGENVGFNRPVNRENNERKLLS